MGRRIAEMDWSATSVGPRETWGKSFQATVGMLLGSRYPMILLWGDELLQFYNDAYIGLIGEKHPHTLGRSIRETMPESWDAIGGMISDVMTTGVPNWVPSQLLPLRRAGYLEEAYFSLSYSAIDDDDGHIAGMLCVCSEVTEQIVGARRLDLLRDLAGAGESRTPKAACETLARILARHALDVPFAAFYLRTPDGVLELAGAANLPETSRPFQGRIRLDATPSLSRALGGERVEIPMPDTIPATGGAFADEVRVSIAMPIRSNDPSAALGVVVIGASPSRPLDEGYRTFAELLAGQVSTFVRSAVAFEAERSRAESLAQLDRDKTAFFGNVSHELRTPLTLILGPIEDALARGTRTLAGKELETVHRNAVRLLRLVNTLLELSRIEAGRTDARFEPTDLAMLTAGLAGSFHSLIESAGLRLVVDCPPLEAPAWVDPGHWEKIVLNLVSNAFKFTFAGEIAVRLVAHDDAFELRVTDTGTGIPEHELARVFERFHRVPGARGRSFEGTGIGLSLVVELARQHGGSVHAESTLGEGSTFVVMIPKGSAHLPREHVASAAPGERPDAGLAYVREASHWLRTGTHTGELRGPEPRPDRTSDAPMLRILVADDNADMREYIVRLLATRWRVEPVEDGQAALESALRAPPDLIVSDVMMPRLDGVALLRALRADPETAMVPVILLSARAGEEAVLTGLETGADDYLVKPFSARELMGRVGVHLDMLQLRRAAMDAARELAETRADLLGDLERKNQELESFSYSVSHDLRAPLRSIDGFSQALAEDFGDVLGEVGRSHLDRVRNAAQRMGALIDDLLDLSRVERAALRPAKVDLSALARRTAELLRKAEPDRRVDLTIEDGLVAWGDVRLFGILLENLLGNAWKFTARRTPAHIEVGTTVRDGARVYFVRDDGAGFDPTYTDRLFSPFQRLHSDAEFPGTGIGLATVRRVVARHGGRVWAEGAVDRGATISWTLPAAETKDG